MYEYCNGCGKSNVRLDNSHVIRRSKRKDLEKVKDNIKKHCRSCHDLWDSGNPVKMSVLKDFIPNMEYIFSVDRERWYSLLFNHFDIDCDYEKEKERVMLYGEIKKTSLL